MKETRPPAVDGRRRNELREATIGRARSYTPQWEPDASDVGTALLSLFADIATDVTARLDRTPEKHRVAFFDALGFNREPPQPARLPLVFQVAEGLAENVAIPAGTQAVAAPEGDEAEQVFEIPDGEGFEATPARLDTVYSVSPDHDAIFEHGTALGVGTETQLFSGTNEQEHALYIGHTDFFTLTPQTEFEVRIDGADVADFERLRWEYYGVAVIDDESVEKWHPLLRRPRPETSAGDDAVILRFKLEPESEFVETTLPADEETDAETAEGEEPRVTEIETRWIRCVSPASLNEDLYETRVSTVSLSLVSHSVNSEQNDSANDGTESGVVVLDGGIGNPPDLNPDMLLANDVPLPTEKTDDPIHPFGEMPLPLDAFYIASDEAFSKKGMTVKLIFSGMVANKAPPPGRPEVETKRRELDLSWEYWNGSGWTYLGLEIDKLWDADEGFIQFKVPSNIQATAVSGHEYHWIRARVREDGYLQFDTGQTYDEDGNIDGPVEGDPVIWELIHEAVPKFESLTIDYPPSSGVSGDNGGNGSNGSNGDDGNGGDPGGPPGETIGQPKNHPQHVVACNNLSYGVDEARRLRHDSETDLRPFRKLPDALMEAPKQTLYLGFNAPLDDGPIQVLFSAVEKSYERGFYPRARWEYCHDPASDRWTQLNANDGTEALTRRGIVSLVFPAATTSFERFGRKRHWIRARLVGEDQFTVTVKTEPSVASSIDIAEIDAEGERVVIRDTGTQIVDLTGYLLDVEYGQPAKQVRALPAGSIVPPGGSLVVGTGRMTVGSHDVDLGYNRYVLNNKEPDTVALLAPDGAFVTATDDLGTTIPPGGETDETRGEIDDIVRPCAEMEPTILGTDPQYTTAPPRIRGLYPNAGWADNIRTVSEETLGSSNGSADQTFTFANRPAVDETVWVDESFSLTEDERATLRDVHPERVDEQTDEDGTVTAFWVKWTVVENFVDSDPDARHYVVDQTMGTLMFGDGTRGAIPPIGEGKIRASYLTGGGVGGNVKEGAVTALVNALPYIEEVTNLDPGWGGADAEPTISATERASQILRDRNRAVTRVDFERLAMSASRELDRVRCIPGMDREGVSRPGWVTVLLVPRTKVPKPMPSPEVKRRVEETLERYAPAPLTRVRPDQVVVRGPSYLEVIVETELVVKASVRSVAAVEGAANDCLAGFLHPLTGGPEDAGWEFGDLPCLSDFYALLERIEGVDHVDSLNVTFRGRDRDHTVTDGDERLPRVTVDTLVFSGNHDVKAEGDVTETIETSEGVA